MDVIVPQMNSEAAAQALDTLKSVNLSKVDDLVILYDLQDYRDDRTVYDEANDKNLTTVYGALTATIKLFQEQCPHIRIYLLSQPTAPSRMQTAKPSTSTAMISATARWSITSTGKSKPAAKNGLEFYHPSPIFCTDNAAMIGVAGYYEYLAGTRSGLDLNAVPNLKLGER